MLDSKLLKEDPKSIEDMLKRRGIEIPLDKLIFLDKRRRELIVEGQNQKHRKNVLADTIAKKKKSKLDATLELEEMKEVGQKIAALEKEKDIVESQFRSMMLLIPNLVHETVPAGRDEMDNVIIKRTEITRKFNFIPKDHIDIAAGLDLVDMERASKISGARFYFLKNDLVKINQALINLAFDILSKHGYTLVQPPYMIRKEAMEGAIILDDFEDVIYKIEDEDLYMIGTSEHAMASMHMGEIIDGKKLPLKYAGFSPCFRKEAGAHGKDMKGIFRVHQFDKVEQFVFSRPEESWNEHEKMLSIAEEFYEMLALPYRVVILCSGDLGKISSKTYDIEAWMPGQDAYREIVSCSNCIDYQARRLGIRFKDRTNEDSRLVHTLNSTLVATERTMVAIIENYQTSKGTVLIPDVLQKYMGDKKEISSA